MIIRQTKKSLLSHILYYLIILVPSSILLYISSSVLISNYETFIQINFVSAVITFIISFIYTINSLYQLLNTYFISMNVVYIHTGSIIYCEHALFKSDKYSEVLVKTISSTTVHQNFIDKLFGTGTLKTKGINIANNKFTLIFNNIPNVLNHIQYKK